MPANTSIIQQIFNKKLKPVEVTAQYRMSKILLNFAEHPM